MTAETTTDALGQARAIGPDLQALRRELHRNLNLGACPVDDYDAAPDNHSPRAAFDDSVLPEAAAWLTEVAVRRLRGSQSGSAPSR